MTGDEPLDLVAPAPGDARRVFEELMQRLEGTGPFTVNDGIRLTIAAGALKTADPPLDDAERAAVAARIDAARARHRRG